MWLGNPATKVNPKASATASDSDSCAWQLLTEPGGEEADYTSANDYNLVSNGWSRVPDRIYGCFHVGS